MAIQNLGDVISGIQARSKPGVTYSVVPQGNGLYGVMRNGTLTWQFIYEPNGLLQLTDRNGTSERADPAQFIQGLS